MRRREMFFLLQFRATGCDSEGEAVGGPGQSWFPSRALTRELVGCRTIRLLKMEWIVAPKE